MSFYDRNRFVERLQQDDINFDGESAETYAQVIFDIPIKQILERRSVFLETLAADVKEELQKIWRLIPQVKPAIDYLLNDEFHAKQLTLFAESNYLTKKKVTDLEQSLYTAFVDELVPSKEYLSQELIKIEKRFHRTIQIHYPLLSHYIQDSSFSIVDGNYYKFVATINWFFHNNEEQSEELWNLLVHIRDHNILPIFKRVLRSSAVFKPAKLNFEYRIIPNKIRPVNIKDSLLQMRRKRMRSNPLDHSEIENETLKSRLARHSWNQEWIEVLNNFLYWMLWPRPNSHKTLMIQGERWTWLSSFAEFTASRIVSLFPNKIVRKYNKSELTRLAQQAASKKSNWLKAGQTDPFNQVSEHILNTDVLIFENAEDLTSKRSAQLICDFLNKKWATCIFVIKNSANYLSNKDNNKYENDGYQEALEKAKKIKLHEPNVADRRKVLDSILLQDYSDPYNKLVLTDLQKDFILEHVTSLHQISSILEDLGIYHGNIQDSQITTALSNYASLRNHLPYHSIYSYLDNFIENNWLAEKFDFKRTQSRHRLIKALSVYMFKWLLEDQNQKPSIEDIAEKCDLKQPAHVHRSLKVINDKLLAWWVLTEYIQEMKSSLKEHRDSYLVNFKIFNK